MEPRSSAGTRGQCLEHLLVMLWLTLPSRLSLLRVIATRTSYRTLFTASYLLEEGQVQGIWGEERCPQDGDGAPPGRDGGVEHPLTNCTVRD
jgi:hypothetical protein